MDSPPRLSAQSVQGTLYITGDPKADDLLNTEPLALLLGMLLDEQVPMERRQSSFARESPRR